MDISIIIVNYRTYDFTKACLDSIFASNRDHLEIEVIVVDNDSNDGSIDKLIDLYNSSVKFIVNSENLGFAKANNIGAQHAQGNYLLLLNSDTVISKDTLTRCFIYMENHHEVGACGCKVVLPNGGLDKACKRSFPTPSNALYNAFKLDKLFPNSKTFGSYNLTYINEDTTCEVECIVGAFMFIRRKCLDEVGLFDERFFMYGEDIDLCYRIRHSGWPIVYYPETQIIHYKGSSAKKKKWAMIWEFHRSMLIYYDKNLGKKNSILVAYLVRLGIYTRYVVALVTNIFRR